MQGRVVAVEEKLFGSELAVATTGGETTIFVEDALDFEEDGGQAQVYVDNVSGEIIQYSSADPDTGALVLTAPIVGAFPAETELVLYPRVIERVAHVMFSDDAGAAEAVEARVPHWLYDRMEVGIRDEGTTDGETVNVEYEGDELVITDMTGQEPLVDGRYLEPGTVSGEAITDGLPPTTSPAIDAVRGGPGYFALEWTALSNADPVEYAVHVSPSSGFTPSASTLYGMSQGTVFFVKAQADGSAFAYGTTYYFRLVASDDDGEAAAGTENSGQMVKVNSPDISANAITAVHVLAANITAEHLEAVLVLGNTIIAGQEAGGRVEIGDGTGMMEGMFGIHAVAADGATITFMIDAESGDIYLRGRMDFGLGSRLLSEDIIEILEQPAGFQVPALAQSPAMGKGNSSTASASWIAPTTKGNLLLLGLHIFDSDGTVPTPTTPSGWTLVAQVAQGPGSGDQRILLYKITNAASRSGSQAVTLNDTCDFTMVLLEYSGSGVEDVAAATAAGTGSPASTGTTGTTTQAQELWIAFLGTKTATDGLPLLVNPTNGFAQVASVSDGLTPTTHAIRQTTFDKKVTATGTAGMAADDSFEVGYVGIVATFKAKTAVVDTPDTGRVRLYAKVDGAGVARLHAMHEDGVEGAVVVGKADEAWRLEIVIVSVNLLSTAAHTAASINVSIPSLAVGDLVCFLGRAGTGGRAFIITPTNPVTTAGQVTLETFNADSGVQDPAAVNYAFLVVHRS
jgi:hypothetical protein